MDNSHHPSTYSDFKRVYSLSDVDVRNRILAAGETEEFLFVPASDDDLDVPSLLLPFDSDQVV